MQAAQGRARDVSRKTALSQVQSAIVVSQWDHWEWPGEKNGALSWIWISSISGDLMEAWMNSVPVDPLNSDVSWLWNGATGDYAYMVLARNWTPKWWFVLMAKTEVPWWSNWVVCSGNWLSGWHIDSTTDIINIHPCDSLTKSWCSAANCTYSTESELRYIILY
jgi:hypothetical protein